MIDNPYFLVYYKEGEYWICHSLATDILAYGSDKAEAFAECNAMIKIQYWELKKNGKLELFYRSAPKEYFEKYKDQLQIQPITLIK